MSQMDIIDISKPISANTPVWPGDTPFSKKSIMSVSAGEMVNLTTLILSAHAASHADAPYHVLDEGLTIDQVELAIYWGPAQIVTVTRTNGPLLPEDFKGYDLLRAPRLLVRTAVENLPYHQFPGSYPYPGPDLADFLRSKGIILYGTDAPSMDAFESHDLPGHRALIGNHIAILECLDLRLAEDGLYELVALPLRIAGGDGSPVRAVVRRSKTDV